MRHEHRFICFPPRRRYLVLPRRPIRASLNGLALYDAVEFHQRFAERVGRAVIRIGAGGVFRLQPNPPLPRPEWWKGWLSLVASHLERPVAGAAFRFKLISDDFSSSGATSLVFDEEGRSLAFAKFSPRQHHRPIPDDVLRRLAAEPPLSFNVPRLLGAGDYGGLHYTLQEALPAGRHRRLGRNTTALSPIVDEIQSKLRDLLASDAPDGWVAAHGSLTPAHLRVGPDGQLWLFDWDKAGSAPKLGDELRYWIADYGKRRWPTVARRGAIVAELLLSRGSREDAIEALRWRERNSPRDVSARVLAVREAVRAELELR